MKLKYFLLTLLAASGISYASPAKTPAPVNMTPSSVYVVSGDEAAASQAGVQIDTPQFEPEHKKPVREVTAADVWSGPVPVHGIAWLLIASMPVLASLYFAYQILVFFRNRRQRLAVRHLDK